MPKIRDFHLQLPYFQTDSSRNMNWLYGIRVARDLIYRLAIFFFPIFLYQQGSSDSFWQFLPGGGLQKGVLLLVLFYLSHRLTVLLTAIAIGKLVIKVGYQKSMLISSSLFALFLSLLYLKANPGWLIIVAAVLNGLETNFFWNAYNTVMSKLSMQRRMGQNLGLLQFLLQLVQAIAPALGGVLVVAFGFTALFLAGLVGALACMLFVSQLELKKERDRVSWKEFMRWTQEATFLQLAASQSGRYLSDAVLVFWPLYVFLILGSIDRVGFLYTFSLFLAMIITFSAGYYIDHRKSKKPFYISGGILSVLWLLRSQVISFWHIAIIDTFDRLTANFYGLFADATSFKRSKGSQAFSYFVYRELMVSFAAVIFWLIIGSLFFIFNNPWTALFMMAAVGVLLGLLVKEHHKS